MQKYYGKQLALLLFSLCGSSCLLAAEPAVPTNGGASNAIAFALQAGQLAGTAQGCGIDVTTFSGRVHEAVAKLALNPTDASAANDSYQQTLQRAQIAQRNNNIMPCSQVLQDFNGLPLMRADYQATVIAQLNPGMADANNNNLPSTAATNPNLQNTTTGTAAYASNSTTAKQNNAGNNAVQATNPATNTAQNNATALPPNSVYSQQSYGPMRATSNNFSGAIQSYSATNTTAAAPASNATAPTNNPAPPSFTNPNNTAPVNQ